MTVMYDVTLNFNSKFKNKKIKRKKNKNEKSNENRLSLPSSILTSVKIYLVVNINKIVLYKK